jgi:uncharacterized protein
VTDDALARIAAALDRMAPAPLPAPDFGAADAFVWHVAPDRLDPVGRVNRIDVGCSWGSTGRATRYWRTRGSSREGLPANNALLWGARGMGKSSLVKAVHGQVVAEGHDLKIVEIQREDLPSIGRLLGHLRGSAARFVLFCDDLSFSHDDQHYKSLKAVLDGGIEGRPDNVVFYATSNRRHLMPRDMIENERSSAINPSEAVEEKVSLSDRFGLWLGFHPCTQDEYLAMIRGYCDALGRGDRRGGPARRGDRVAGDARRALGPGGVAVFHRSRRTPRRPDRVARGLVAETHEGAARVGARAEPARHDLGHVIDDTLAFRLALEPRQDRVGLGMGDKRRGHTLRRHEDLPRAPVDDGDPEHDVMDGGRRPVDRDRRDAVEPVDRDVDFHRPSAGKRRRRRPGAFGDDRGDLCLAVSGGFAVPDDIGDGDEHVVVAHCAVVVDDRPDIHDVPGAADLRRHLLGVVRGEPAAAPRQENCRHYGGAERFLAHLETLRWTVWPLTLIGFT